nr:histidine kinase [Streptomyces sp. SID11385]
MGILLLISPFLPGLRGHGTELGDLPDRPLDALAALVLVLECLPFAFRRRRPGLCLALVAGGFAVDQLCGYHTTAGTALLFMLISAGSHLESRRRAAVALLTAAYVVLAVALAWRGGDGEAPEEFATFYLLLAAAWAAGAWLRATRLAEAERRRHVAIETRTAERTHIARELHDVVTHHVTAMVVQAEAARYLTAAPGRLEQSLAAVGETGREALADLRHLLGLLDPDAGARGPGGARGSMEREEHEEPRTPAADELLTLVEQARRAGQPVDFTERGVPRASAGSAALVACRVVREALTNALKYAHGSRTSVQVRHGEGDITVEVGTGAGGARSAAAVGGGRGLEGLRARVDVLGGEFSAGEAADGGFTVRARIPVGGIS